MVLYINSGLTPSPFIWFISPIKQFGWHNTLKSLFFFLLRTSETFLHCLLPLNRAVKKFETLWCFFWIGKEFSPHSWSTLTSSRCFGVRCFLWDSLEHGVLFQWGFILSFQQDVSHLSVACFQLLCLFFFWPPITCMWMCICLPTTVFSRINLYGLNSSFTCTHPKPFLLC